MQDNKETIPSLPIIIQPQPQLETIKNEKDDCERTLPTAAPACPKCLIASAKHVFCPTCNMKFSGKFTLKRHIQNVHENLKLFCCVLCNRSFAAKIHLERHLLIHSGEKPFSCSVCLKAFRHKNALKRHFANFHNFL